MTSQSSPTKNRGGRSSKPYRTTWGEEIHGLYRMPDRPNLWRIVTTRERFTESDERRAIQIFRQKVQDSQASIEIPMMVDEDKLPTDNDPITPLESAFSYTTGPGGQTIYHPKNRRSETVGMVPRTAY